MVIQFNLEIAKVIGWGGGLLDPGIVIWKVFNDFV